MSLVVKNVSGFFSNCSVKFNLITNFINYHKSLPNSIECSDQFQWYKVEDRDITYEYFEHYDNIEMNINPFIPINYHISYQFVDYSKLEYANLCPIIEKYFAPSEQIKNIINKMETKYNIDYNNICVLFYRGNDKNTETYICGYDEYIEKAKQILSKNPNILFLIQSDETEFIELILFLFPNNSFYFKDEIRHIHKCNSTVDIIMKDKNYVFSKYYLAITIIMAKCKYLVCGSGNCSLFILLYRGNSNKMYQNLNGNWIITE